MVRKSENSVIVSSDRIAYSAQYGFVVEKTEKTRQKIHRNWKIATSTAPSLIQRRTTRAAANCAPQTHSGEAPPSTRLGGDSGRIEQLSRGTLGSAKLAPAKGRRRGHRAHWTESCRARTTRDKRWHHRRAEAKLNRCRLPPCAVGKMRNAELGTRGEIAPVGVVADENIVVSTHPVQGAPELHSTFYHQLSRRFLLRKQSSKIHFIHQFSPGAWGTLRFERFNA